MSDDKESVANGKIYLVATDGTKTHIGFDNMEFTDSDDSKELQNEILTFASNTEKAFSQIKNMSMEMSALNVKIMDELYGTPSKANHELLHPLSKIVCEIDYHKSTSGNLNVRLTARWGADAMSQGFIISAAVLASTNSEYVNEVIYKNIADFQYQLMKEHWPKADYIQGFTESLYSHKAVALPVIDATGAYPKSNDGFVKQGEPLSPNDIWGLTDAMQKFYPGAKDQLKTKSYQGNSGLAFSKKSRALPGMDKSCPPCPKECGVETPRLADMVIHLNDRHRLTREQIAATLQGWHDEGRINIAFEVQEPDYDKDS